MLRDIPISDDFPDGFENALASLVIEYGRLEYLVHLCIKDLIGKDFDSGMIDAIKNSRYGRLFQRALELAEQRLTTSE